MTRIGRRGPRISRSAFSEHLNQNIAGMIDSITEADAVQGTRAYLDLILTEQQILSADRAGQRLVTATYVLAGSTVALVIATVALLFKGPGG